MLIGFCVVIKSGIVGGSVSRLIGRILEWLSTSRFVSGLVGKSGGSVVDRFRGVIKSSLVHGSVAWSVGRLVGRVAKWFVISWCVVWSTVRLPGRWVGRAVGWSGGLYGPARLLLKR